LVDCALLIVRRVKGRCGTRFARVLAPTPDGAGPLTRLVGYRSENAETAALSGCGRRSRGNTAQVWWSRWDAGRSRWAVPHWGPG
jgi:hypothetical protein